MINVTKTFLPSFEEYCEVLKRAWDKGWITNNGELVQELEQKLKSYLGVKHLFITNNGTVVLQMALKAYGITKEVITTPFSYVATTNAILWERCTPVFVDIHPSDFCIDADKIERSITENTEAILATHVYGLPCNIEKIQLLADKYSLKVIYDGAHAFGGMYNGKQLLSYGDISTCSFHATKLFHTVEGGCIITDDDAVAEKLMLFRQFGHINENYYSVGINAKISEFHAAMGLAVFNHYPKIADRKKEQWLQYKAILGTTLDWSNKDFIYNFSYYPLVFQSEEILLKCLKELRTNDIIARRYFYPSLNTLPFVNGEPCEISEDIAKRVICLPLFFELDSETINRISSIVRQYI